MNHQGGICLRRTTKTIALFLIITFSFMFVTHGIIYGLTEADVLAFSHPIINVLAILGGGAPAFAALYLVFKIYSEEEKKAYWQRVYDVKVAWPWWVFLVFAPLLLGFSSQVVVLGALPEIDLALSVLTSLPFVFLTMIFAGGAEELGWRGILQRHLHGRLSLPLIGLIIGVLWGVWHLPLFFIEALAHANYHFFTYLLTTILFSLWMTGMVHQTKSVGLAILFHAMINTAGQIGFGLSMTFDLGNVVLLVALIVISCVWLVMLDKASPYREKHFTE